MIVAEDITARFLNVISLFNGSIPLDRHPAQRHRGRRRGHPRVHDGPRRTTLRRRGGRRGREPRDRAYWEAKGSPATLEMTDELLALVREVEPGVALKYNKHYIGLLARRRRELRELPTAPKTCIAEFKSPV